MDGTKPSVTVLAGGVGGAKLAQGLARLGHDLAVVVNTADDFELHGLAISPDLDTVTYTLAGLANETTGWGVRGDTYEALSAMGRLGEQTWFALGDRDLATHIVRTSRRRQGMPLSAVTRQITTALGVRAAVLPMTDDPVRTVVLTPGGRLDFQEYFVARQHRDDVVGLELVGIEDAQPAPGVLAALEGSGVVVVAPSNPFVSIGPILAVPGVRQALAETSATRIAVSPIVGGRAVKGPAAAMLSTLGHEVSPLGVARLYTGVLDAFCIDHRDRQLADAIAELGVQVVVTDTMMGGPEDRERLARDLLHLVGYG